MRTKALHVRTHIPTELDFGCLLVTPNEYNVSGPIDWCMIYSRSTGVVVITVEYVHKAIDSSRISSFDLLKLADKDRW